MLKVAIIIGSTRPGRKAEVVARWVYDIASKRSDAAFEIVDIKDFNPPLLDEPNVGVCTSINNCNPGQRICCVAK